MVQHVQSAEGGEEVPKKNIADSFGYPITKYNQKHDKLVKTGGEGFTTSFASKIDIQQKRYLRLEALLGDETTLVDVNALETAEASTPIGKVLELQVAKPTEVTTLVVNPRSAPVQSLAVETTIHESTALGKCKLVWSS